MAQAPLGLYLLTENVLSALTRRRDLPAEMGGWMTSAKAGLKPSWDELAEAAAKQPAATVFVEAAAFGNDGHGPDRSPVNFQDLLFVIHTLHHFLEERPVTLSEKAQKRATGALVKLVKIYLFFLECVPTIQEPKSVLLETFVSKYGDADLQAMQGASAAIGETKQSVGNAG